MNSKLRARAGLVVVAWIGASGAVTTTRGQDAPGTEQAADAPTPPPADAAEIDAINELVLQGSYAEAETRLARLRETRPDDPALLLQHGEVLLALGRPAEARTVLERSAELAPDRDRTYFQLGTALQALGEQDLALQAFGRTIDVTQDDTMRRMSHLNRSVLLDQAKRWPEAAAEIEAALQIPPTDAALYGDLAALHLKAGNTTAASEVLARGAAAGFKSAEHYYSLGARLYRDDQHADAAKAFEQALEVNPQMARAEKSLGACLEKLGRNDEAVVHLKRYLELSPQAADADKVKERIRSAGNAKASKK